MGMHPESTTFQPAGDGCAQLAAFCTCNHLCAASLIEAMVIMKVAGIAKAFEYLQQRRMAS